jgi:hypothetical protein
LRPPVLGFAAWGVAASSALLIVAVVG